MDIKKSVLERFVRYCSFETTSDDNVKSCPSTPGQKIFANVLLDELLSLGVKAHVSADGYVYGEIPSNMESKVNTIGFIAHMDTSPDFSGKNVSPRIIYGYDGSDICLNENEELYLRAGEFSELKHYIGGTLITTDGKTLLGADDKAGIAEIITMCEYLMLHPEVKHGSVKIAFTPDEEIGRGAELFEVDTFGADFAYTVDGGELGELEYENFNAAKAEIEIQGRSIHPGYAKGKMTNSLTIAAELQGMIPPEEAPEYTEKYEGFYHLIKISGTVEKTSVKYLIREHDKDLFENRKKFLADAVDRLNKKYAGAITIKITDQYYNMKEHINPVMHIVDLAFKAMSDTGVIPLVKPIRGGTDGATLSYRGLPCPNIFTGGHNFHGKYEFIPLESMEKAVRVLLAIIKNASSNL